MALSAEQIRALAHTLLALRDGKDGESIPTIDLKDAYAIQGALDALVRERGWTPIGYKVGATNAPTRQKMHLDKPFYGRLYRELSSQSGAEVPFVPNFSIMIEAEIAVEIGDDLPPGARPYSAADLKAATRSIAPAFEFVGSVFKKIGSMTAPNLVADFAGLAHWVVGKKITDFQNLDVLEAPILVYANGEQKAAGKGANVDGGPFASAAFMANAMAQLGVPLKAGDLITTGSIITPIPAEANLHLKADFGPIGIVEAFFKESIK